MLLFLSASAALVLGSGTYPRPCSGFSGFEQQKCFCQYHPTGGSYVWPFSTGKMKCRQVIYCHVADPSLRDCPTNAVADDLEFNGVAQCFPEPDNFECSIGGKLDFLLRIWSIDE
jgi:hypothetical protein